MISHEPEASRKSRLLELASESEGSDPSTAVRPGSKPYDERILSRLRDRCTLHLSLLRQVHLSNLTQTRPSLKAGLGNRRILVLVPVSVSACSSLQIQEGPSVFSQNLQRSEPEVSDQDEASSRCQCAFVLRTAERGLAVSSARSAVSWGNSRYVTLL